MLSSLTITLKYPTTSILTEGDLQSLELDKIETLEVYSEEKAKEVFQEIEKLQKNASVEPSVVILKPKKNDYLVMAAAYSKSWYRTEFKAMALLAGSLKLATAGDYLYHSLQNSPPNRSNAAGSRHSNALSLTKMYTTISVPMAAAIDKAKAAGETSAGDSSSISTTVDNVGMDFYLTYGKISYYWGASKLSNGNWAVNIVISDLYDYNKIQKVSSTFPQNMIDLANNHAYDAQQTGAIVKYNVTTLFNQTYTPK